MSHLGKQSQFNQMLASLSEVVAEWPRTGPGCEEIIDCPRCTSCFLLDLRSLCGQLLLLLLLLLKHKVV